MPSARVRFAGEAAFLVLVAVGLGLARFSPVVIAVVMIVACVLVAVLERVAAREAARERLGLAPVTQDEEPAAEPQAAAEAPAERSPEAEPQPDPEPAVDERSARAILASGPPPLPPEPAGPKRRLPRRVARRSASARPAAPPPRASRPEPEPVRSGPAREWNLWELQRAARDAPDNEARREEWSALLIHLREFANADGDLPVEFDSLVRESFGPLLEAEAEAAAAT